MQRGLGAIDARTASGKKAMRFRVELISDLGGEAEITAGKRVAINRATGILWELAEIDAYEIELTALKGSIVNKQTRSLPPVILEKHRLEHILVELLDRLYEGKTWRRKQQVLTLAELLAQGDDGEGQDDEQGGGGGDHDEGGGSEDKAPPVNNSS